MQPTQAIDPTRYPKPENSIEVDIWNSGGFSVVFALNKDVVLYNLYLTVAAKPLIQSSCRKNCDKGCVQAVDRAGGMSCTSGCTKHIILPFCKYCKGSDPPTQLKLFPPESIPRLSDSYKLDCMYPLADGISNRFRHVCPPAYLNMTAHPESDCRIGHDTANIRPFAHMTTTLGTSFLD